MSARSKTTLVSPAVSTRCLATASDSSEMSMEVMAAPGLLRASVTVCAPTPQPASSTRPPAGKAVPECRKSVSAVAWSTSRSLSLGVYPWT